MFRNLFYFSQSKHLSIFRCLLIFSITLLALFLVVILRFRFNTKLLFNRQLFQDSNTLTSSHSDISLSPYSSIDKTLEYRRILELTTSPRNFNQHHPTLGFSHIYCISLPTRKDRRKTMNKIASALGINLTFVDAIPKEHPVIGWIGEHAAEVRRIKWNLISEYSGLPKEQIGGMGPRSVWLTVNNGQASNPAFLSDIQLPSLSEAHPEFNGKNWVDYLWSVSDHYTLKSKDPEFNVTAEMWDNQEKMIQRQINSATVSTYYNHLRVLRMIRDSGQDSALILEDDVDLEWDLERRWRSIERHLPANWDTVFLGHCWGHELLQPQLGHPHLHKSTEPLCLHGYAVSSRGSKKLLELYNDPWTSFQTPVDTCIPTFIQLGLNSYSIEPTIINQSKILQSDIQSGKGSNWKGLLVDSILERILKSEGVIPSDFLNHNNNIDPATIFRYKPSFFKNMKSKECKKDAE